MKWVTKVTTDIATSLDNDILLRDWARALDASILMEDVGLWPDEWQRELLRNDADDILLLTSRQVGKSTVTAMKALHTMLYKPGSLVLILSPSDRQSAETFKKLTEFYADFGKPVEEKYATLRSLELKNGSRCLSLPGNEKTVRGMSGVDLMVIDEASRVPDELYRGVSPMLAVSQGQRIVLSTPYGKRGFLYEEWKDEESPWRKIRVPATDCQRISAEFLKSERRALGDLWYRQEYLCEFLDGVNSLFNYDAIMAALDASIEPLSIELPQREDVLI